MIAVPVPAGLVVSAPVPAATAEVLDAAGTVVARLPLTAFAP